MTDVSGHHGPGGAGDEPRVIAGKYRLDHEIASGGMGTVYRASHLLTHRTVALKLLHPMLAKDDASRQRFFREVSAPARIGHPGICEVFDAGADQDGALYVAMELLQGETLRDYFERTDATINEKLDLLEQALEPLAAAHRKGLVHRDLKPENIFVVEDQTKARVKLLDFGIVRELSSAALTQAGVAMGTPEYMSPEQATSARDVCPASDVWSMGVMIYEAVSTKLPFAGATPSAVVVEVMTRPHPPLKTLAPNTPAALSSLIDHCLQKKPEHRPADADALLSELRDARGDSRGNAPHDEQTGSSFAGATSPAALHRSGPAGTGFRDEPTSTPKRSGTGCLLAGILLASAGLIVLLLVGVAFGALLLTRKPRHAPPPSTGLPSVQRFQGSLSVSDGTLESGEYRDAHRFQWQGGRGITVRLQSTAFDAYLIHRAPSGKQSEDDDGGGGDDAEIRLSDVEPGTHLILVTSYEAGETGDYVLSVTKDP